MLENSNARLTNQHRGCSGLTPPTFAPDQGVNLLRLDIVHALHGILNLFLVGLKVNNEYQGVVVLNLLHR